MWTGGFVTQAGYGDAVVWENVKGVGGVIPFDVGELTKIREIFVRETTVGEDLGHVGMLGDVFRVELLGLKVEPLLDLLFGWEAKIAR